MAYTETDAAAITPGQKVRLTFDAVPDLELTGSVLSVSPTATAISGVISYYVTVVLPKGDPRLKSGMTAQAEVLTKEIPGVLAVPSAAVHTQNGTSVVTVLDPERHPAHGHRADRRDGRRQDADPVRRHGGAAGRAACQNGAP